MTIVWTFTYFKGWLCYFDFLNFYFELTKEPSSSCRPRIDSFPTFPQGYQFSLTIV